MSSAVGVKRWSSDDARVVFDVKDLGTLSIVVPFYNEAGNIRPLVLETLAAFSNYPNAWEIILVDDGSQDGTWAEMTQLSAEDPRIRSFRHTENRGQSRALQTGFHAATGNILCTMDGDGQNNPRDFVRFLAVLADWDLVCGYRAKRQDPWIRRVSSKLARIARKRALRWDFADTGCALRVFRREVLQEIWLFNGFHRFLPVLVAATGKRCLEMECDHRPRQCGISKYGVGNRLFRGLWDLLGVRWWMGRLLKPVTVESAPSCTIIKVESSNLSSRT